MQSPIKITFKNMESSELAKEAVLNRLEAVAEKFERLDKSRIQVTLEMQNSPLQAGPDLFQVKVQINGGLYNGVRMSKSASNLYVALADVAEHLLEVLNRYSDKIRVVNRARSRRQGKVVDATTEQ